MILKSVKENPTPNASPSELAYMSTPTSSETRITDTSDYSEPPKIFWKFYDLYRRKKMSLGEYAIATNLSVSLIQRYLKNKAAEVPETIELSQQL